MVNGAEPGGLDNPLVTFTSKASDVDIVFLVFVGDGMRPLTVDKFTAAVGSGISS